MKPHIVLFRSKKGAKSWFRRDNKAIGWGKTPCEAFTNWQVHFESI